MSQGPLAAHNRVWSGVGFALAVVLIWSSFSLAGRYSARAGLAGLTPWDVAALRFGVAFCVVAPAAALGVGRGLPWRRGLVLALLGGLGFALPALSGFLFAPAAHGALVMSGSLPFLVAAGAALMFGQRWGLARVASLAILLAGVALFGIEAAWHGHAPAGAWRGELLFLCAALSWTGYTLLARAWSPRPAQTIVALGLWCAPLYLPVYALFLPSHIARAPWGEIVFQGVFQGIVAVIVSLYVYLRALQAMGPTRLAGMAAMVPGMTAVLAVPLLGEPLGLLSVAGLALVGAAVAVGARA